MAAVDKPDASAASLEKMAVIIGKAVTNLLKSILDGSPVSLNDPFYRCDDSVKVNMSLLLWLFGILSARQHY